MSFNTYYINLDSQPLRNNETKEELEKTNLIYIRFPGIDGSKVNKQSLVNDGYISSFCKSIGTSKMIGLGISHIKLYEYIKEIDTHDYALILEDDILITNPNLDYTKEINDIVALYQNKDPQWDIIRLHSMGYGMGSTAAYIVNLKYIEKFTSMNLHYHTDIQQSSSYNVFNLNTLFNTRDHMITYKNPIYNLYFDNQKIGFYVNNAAFVIFSYVVYFYHIFWAFVFIILFYIIIRVFRYLKRRNIIPF